MGEYLFSYGTLKKDNVQLALFGRLLKGTKDTLKGWKISTVEISDPTFLARGEEKYQRMAIKSNENGIEIAGTAFEMTPEELHMADKYEPDGYARIEVLLESGKRAWIYTSV